MRRLAAIATILGGLAWMGPPLSALGVALGVGPVPYGALAIPASLALLAMGSAGSLATRTWGGGRGVTAGLAAVAVGGALAAVTAGLAAVALGGVLGAVSLTGITALYAIGLWLVLGGSIAAGSWLWRLGRSAGDSGILRAGVGLVVSGVGLVGLAFLSRGGPVGIFGLDGFSTISKVFALVHLAFGGSWAWVGWRAKERPPAPAESAGQPIARRTWVVGLAAAGAVGLIVVGVAVDWAGATKGPAGPPVDTRFEGVGGEERHPIVFPGGDARFEWDVRDCGAGIGPHEVLAMDLYREYDNDHPPDPEPPWFLGGSRRRILPPSRLILGREYGAGGPVTGMTSIHLEGGLWSLHVEMPGSCHWRVAVSSL